MDVTNYGYLDAYKRDEHMRKMRGTLVDAYEIYLENTDDNPPLTFDEWLEN